MENEKLVEQITKPTEIGNDIGKFVPKFCNGVGLELLNNKRNVIITMAFDDGYNKGVLIDRVVVDIDLIVAIKKTCEQILKEVVDEN